MTPSNVPPLDGRHILIAGGASGIGRATAVRCAGAGARVAVIDRNEWAGEPKPAVTCVADVRDTAAVDAGVAAAGAAIGGIDGVIYCAASTLRRRCGRQTMPTGSGCWT